MMACQVKYILHDASYIKYNIVKYRNTAMQNNTSSKFRFRNSVHQRQRKLITDQNQSTHHQEHQEDQEHIKKRGFSSQYMNLAKKFKIKIVSERLTDLSKESIDIKRLTSVRLKTQFSKEKQRYPLESPMQFISIKPHCISINDLKQQFNKTKTKPYFFSNKRNSFYKDVESNKKMEDSKLRIDELIDDQRDESKLNTGEEVLDEIQNLANHAKKVSKIVEILRQKVMNEKGLIKQIKQYVLRQENCSLMKVDEILKDPLEKKSMKQLICLERVILISLTDHMSHNKFHFIADEVQDCLDHILAFYFQLINQAYQKDIYNFEIKYQSKLKTILNSAANFKITTKRNVIALNKFIHSKIRLIFRINQDLLDKIQETLQQSLHLSVNRTFYDLLTQYATYINQNEKKFNVLLSSVCFFATCPSPYILKAALKQYTLVVDLDETLLHSTFKDGQFTTAYRPGCHEFLEELSAYYEIIVFTSSVESYAKEVSKQFAGIQHFLFRQHAVRVSTGFIKDLNRVGRHLERTLIVDDIQNNFKLQKQNGIKITAWRGNQKDEELFHLKQILIDIIICKPVDIRLKLKEFLPKIKQIQSHQLKQIQKSIDSKQIKS